MEISWQNLVLNVDFGDMTEEWLGSMNATIDLELFQKVQAETKFPLNDPECAEQEEIYISIPDDLIAFLAAANEVLEPKTEIEIEYLGSQYWFFHDLIHARYDMYEDGIQVTDTSEDRALLLGAKLAAEHGVSLAEIIPQLYQATDQYKERFGCSTYALDNFSKLLSYSPD